MDYLKRFLTFNILSVIGYGVLGACIYNFAGMLHYGLYNLPGMALVFAFLACGAYTIMLLTYIPLGLFCEFLILFFLSRILKKQIGLNIENKVYDIMFRFGIFCAFLPVAIASTFALWMILGSIFKFSGDFWITLITSCFCTFDMEIKCIFFKKYFEEKAK